MNQRPSNLVYEFDDFRVDSQRRMLSSRSSEQPLPITGKVFDTLLYMVEHSGELLDKRTLMEALWPEVVVEESNLTQTIHTLRRVLGERPGEHRYIVTVAGRGYRFVANVTRCDPDATATSAKSDAGVVATAPKSHRKHLMGMVAAALVLVAAGYAFMRPPQTPPTAAIPSIAVLPFVDMSPAKDQEYFADGLTEELTDHMSRIHGLRVVARTSAFAFKGKHVDIREIANTLDAQNVLEGSVRRDGETLRITTQLIDANGKHIWSQTYDRKRADVFAIQEEVSRSVAGVLSVTIDRKPLDEGRGGTRNLEAYDAYLAARAALGDPTFAPADKLSYGIEQFRRATTLDPDFAYAWAWMAMTYYRGVFLRARDVPGWTTEASHAAKRAREIAPNEPTVLAATALEAMQAQE